MKKIRYKICETNSSSSHSVTVGNTPLFVYPSDQIVNLDKNFGWGYREYNNFSDKLQYALLMVCCTEIYTESYYIHTIPDEFYETEGYKQIAESLKKNLGWEDVEIEITYDYVGIDHQSYEDYNSLQDFLDWYGVDIDRFLFDKNVVLIIDNDNH